jgi:hypothetical protein
MATTKTSPVKRVSSKAAAKSEEQKKISKFGQWIRNHPKGFIIINDPSVLNG